MLSSYLIGMARKNNADHKDMMRDCSESLQLLSFPPFHSYKPKCLCLTSFKMLGKIIVTLPFQAELRVKSGAEMRQADTVTRSGEFN